MTYGDREAHHRKTWERTGKKPKALEELPELSAAEREVWDCFAMELCNRRAWIMGDPQPLGTQISDWLSEEAIAPAARGPVGRILRRLDSEWVRDFYEKRAKTRPGKKRG